MERMEKLIEEIKQSKKMHIEERLETKNCRVLSRYSWLTISLNTGAYLEYIQSVSVTSYDGVRANSV